MRNVMGMLIILGALFFLSGCGETFNGVSKDFNRIGSGVHKVFIRDKS